MIDADKVGTFAIDLDGSNERQLISWRSDTHTTGNRIRNRMLAFSWFYWKPALDGSSDFFVYRLLEGNKGFAARELARLNTGNGRMTRLNDGQPEGVDKWVLDDSGALRVVSASMDGMQRLYWKPTETAEWQLLEEHPEFLCRSSDTTT